MRQFVLPPIAVEFTSWPLLARTTGLGSRDRARRLSIVAEARWRVRLSAAVAALLTVNGFFLLVERPLE
jgi:hypothetical protein